jgi:hypothetical protein
MIHCLLSLAGLTRRNAPQQVRWLPMQPEFRQNRFLRFWPINNYAARIPLASAASAAARSVRSQVNSGSVRPKCP